MARGNLTPQSAVRETCTTMAPSSSEVSKQSERALSTTGSQSSASPSSSPSSMQGQEKASSVFSHGQLSPPSGHWHSAGQMQSLVSCHGQSLADSWGQSHSHDSPEPVFQLKGTPLHLVR